MIVTAEGQVKVLDFGLAKLERAPAPMSETRTLEPTLAQAGAVIRTIAYMSPEQPRAGEVDARTDLFSFGAVLDEMATGRRAFLQALDSSPPPTNPLPLELRRIVLKLLEVDAALRYQMAADVATDLKRLQRPRKAGRRCGAGGWRPWRRSRRWLWPWWRSAVVALFYLRASQPAGRDQWLQLTNFPVR